MARTGRPIIERPERPGRVQRIRRRHDGRQRPVRGQPIGRGHVRTDRIRLQALMQLPDHRRRPGESGPDQHDPTLRRLVRWNLGPTQPPSGRGIDHHRGRQGRTNLRVQRVAPRQGLRMLRPPDPMAGRRKSKRTSTSRLPSRSPTTGRWTGHSATAASAVRS